MEKLDFTLCGWEFDPSNVLLPDSGLLESDNTLSLPEFYPYQILPETDLEGNRSPPKQKPAALEDRVTLVELKPELAKRAQKRLLCDEDELWQLSPTESEFSPEESGGKTKKRAKKNIYEKEEAEIQKLQELGLVEEAGKKLKVLERKKKNRESSLLSRERTKQKLEKTEFLEKEHKTLKKKYKKICEQAALVAMLVQPLLGTSEESRKILEETRKLLQIAEEK
jgi:hypothetical protein